MVKFDQWAFGLETTAEKIAKEGNGGYMNINYWRIRGARQCLKIRKWLVALPEKIQHHEQRIEELRLAAELLGMVDDEDLYLPGSVSLSRLEAHFADDTRHRSWKYAW